LIIAEAALRVAEAWVDGVGLSCLNWLLTALIISGK